MIIISYVASTNNICIEFIFIFSKERTFEWDSSFYICRCKSGTGSFDSLYQQATSQANINNDQCSNDAMIQLPSKADIQGTVQSVAATLKFNPDCSSNKQRDRAKGKTRKSQKLRLKFQDDNAKQEELSTSTKWNICGVMKNQKWSISKVAGVFGIAQAIINAVDCAQLLKNEL